MAYDSVGGDQYVVLYGGLEQTTLGSGALSWHISGDTWAYVQGRWLNLTRFISGQTPGPRWDAMMTYDASDGYILLYGGCLAPPVNGLCGRTIGDTWSYVAGRWTQLAGPPPPPPPPGPGGGGPPPPPGPAIPNPRWDGALAWDDAIRAPGGRTGAVVLFGGANGLRDNLTPVNLGAQIHIWDDTWEWVAGAWTQLTPSVSPPAMYGARMATDSVSSATILFGGTDAVRYDTPPVNVDFFAASNRSGGAFKDTWQLLTTGTWQRLNFNPPTPGPPPLPEPAARWDFVLATSGSSFMSGGDAILMIGGTNATGTILDDAWIFQGTTQGWATLPGPPSAPGTVTPSPRWGGALAFDGFDKTFLLFGGSSLSGSALGDAWTLVLGGPWARALPWSAGPANPGHRYSASAAFDDIAHTGVLFGGESCGASSCTFLGDTWTYAQGQWSPLQLALTPAPRFGAALAYYPDSQAVVLFGGCGVVCPMGDTWIYSAQEFGTGTWTQIFAPVAPPARYFATLSYVPQARQLVLFGGCEGSVGPCPAGDTWLFSGSGTWKHDPLSVTGNLPPPRFGAAAASMPNQGTILFGGMGVGGPLQDTWNYSFFQPSVSAPSSGAAVLGWHTVSARTTPPPRVFGSLAFDQVENWFVLFGGCEPSACPAQDPWVFNITTVPPPPGVGPPPPDPWKVMPKIQIAGPAVTWNVTLAAEYGVAAFWDPIESSEGYLVAFGGRGITGSTHGGTFASIGDYWYDLTPFV